MMHRESSMFDYSISIVVDSWPPKQRIFVKMQSIINISLDVLVLFLDALCFQTCWLFLQYQCGSPTVSWRTSWGPRSCSRGTRWALSGRRRRRRERGGRSGCSQTRVPQFWLWWLTLASSPLTLCVTGCTFYFQNILFHHKIWQPRLLTNQYFLSNILQQLSDDTIKLSSC